MAEQKSNVSWDAALYIWWSQIWRVLSANAFMAFLVMAASKLMPVVHKLLFDLTTNFEGTSLLLLLFFEFFLHMWAIKNSFMDHYPTFIFTAETKRSGKSIMGFDRRLPSDAVLAVWWAQTWRMLLIPGAIIGGGLASQFARHPTAANYLHLLDNNITRLTLYATLVISIWATKESLGDKYRTFRFTAKHKSVYHN